MQRKAKHTYIILIAALVLVACKQTKYVPDDKYLLSKNKIAQVKGSPFSDDELEEILRQQPNRSSLFIKWKLGAYNMVDTAKVFAKRERRNQELREKNRKRKARELEINTRRMAKAREKGDSLYTKKIKPLKDTITPSMFFREWVMRKMGQPPVIFDSIRFNKSVEQLKAYLQSKGYYHNEVAGFVEYRNNRKAKVTYAINPGEAYYIDSFYIDSGGVRAVNSYKKFLKENEVDFVGEKFDIEMLDEHRNAVAAFMRDQSYYGFSSSHIVYLVDSTNRPGMGVKIGVFIQDRLVRHPYYSDSIIQKGHTYGYVRNVYFHISDSLYYRGSFEERLKAEGISTKFPQYLPTLDTFYYKGIGRYGKLDKMRDITVLYNGKMPVKPILLEYQNYLERTNYYKEYYLERSYNSLLRLDLFSGIKLELEENPMTDSIDVHYYLIPKKKQSFGFKPQGTHSNGIYGVSASINYSNRNLFRSGQKLTISFSGGFETQPPVLDQGATGGPEQDAARSFNTFEIGPSVEFQIPWFFPLKIRNLSKRKRPITTISAAYNLQKRDDFDRKIVQLNYNWNFYVGKTQIFYMGLPGASVVKYVDIARSTEFEQTLFELNDLFLINAYTTQLIWQDWKLSYELSNKNKPKSKKKTDWIMYYKVTADAAGNTLSLFRNFQDTMDDGRHKIFGIPYSQFVRVDNELMLADPIGKKHSLNFSFKAGAGRPFGNSTSSMPYDYSFFAGGSNDNRGWRARALGPGAYEYYLDTNRAATQIGDIRIGGSIEYRFPITSLLKGGLFLDAGNIWTIHEDERKSGNFTPEFYKQFALAGGFGLRLDFDYFVIRLDIGIPLRDPAYPTSSQWIFQDRKAYRDAGKDAFGTDLVTLSNDKQVEKWELYLPKPFRPKFHIALGYPF